MIELYGSTFANLEIVHEGHPELNHPDASHEE